MQRQYQLHSWHTRPIRLQIYFSTGLLHGRIFKRTSSRTRHRACDRLRMAALGRCTFIASHEAWVIRLLLIFVFTTTPTYVNKYSLRPMFMQSDVTCHGTDDLLSRMIHSCSLHVGIQCSMLAHIHKGRAKSTLHILRCLDSSTRRTRQDLPTSFTNHQKIASITSQHGSPLAQINNEPACAKCQPRAQLIQLFCRRRSRAVDHGDISRLQSDYNLHLANNPRHTPCAQTQKLRVPGLRHQYATQSGNHKRWETGRFHVQTRQ